MPHLVAEVPEQGPVRLVHLDSQLLAVDVVALGQIQCDDAVVVPGDHFFVRTGQQAEGQPVIRILVAPDDRQLELVQLGDQPPLGRFGPREFGQADGVGIVRPLHSQRARRAHSPG